MIITENDSKATLKTPGVSPGMRPSTFGSAAVVVSPPAYERSPSLPVDASNERTAALLPRVAPMRRESPRMRFFKAYLVALIVYLLLAGLLGSLMNATIKEFNDVRRWGDPATPDASDGNISSSNLCKPDWSEIVSSLDAVKDERQSSMFPLHDGRQDVKHDENPEDRSPLIIYKAQYSLPATIESFYTVARGSHSQGRVRYEPYHGAKVIVDVEMRFWSPDARKAVKMCILRKDGKNQGWGIFTPHSHWHWFDDNKRLIFFDVVVRLPVGRVQKLKNLSSHLPNFAQLVGDFESTYWNTISFFSSNAPIFSKTRLNAHAVSIKTGNAPIRGRFSSDKSIVLQTTNDLIIADIELLNEGGASTTANIQTSNGRLNVSATLATVSPDEHSYPGTGGQFVLSAKTSNGPLTFSVPVAPLSTAIDLVATASNAPADTFLYRTFEGAFRLTSSHAKSPQAISTLSKDDDPMHDGRAPKLAISRQSSNNLEGIFWWGSMLQMVTKCSAQISTSNAKNTLTFI